jgi:DNA-directed RNA polymerase subunit RPC12/RpoP
MIRQVCPNCYKPIELPDDTAGKEAACPNCGKPVAVPPRYTPEVAAGGGVAPAVAPDTYRVLPSEPNTGVKPMSTVPPASSPPAAPPPGLTPPPGVAPPPAPSAPLSADLYTGGAGVTLNPLWLVWVPVGCFALAFVLYFFFTWARLAPGGYTVLTQNGWQAAFGGHDGTVPEVKEWKELESSLPTRLTWDLLIVPYTVLLLAAVALAAVERVLKDPKPRDLPAPLMWLPQVWPYLLYILIGLAAATFVLLYLASLRGFSLERVPHELARLEPSVEKALEAGPTGTELRRVNIQVGQNAARFAPGQTVWLNLLLIAHVVALLALLARLWLVARGPKPFPRIGVQW